MPARSIADWRSIAYFRRCRAFCIFEDYGGTLSFRDAPVRKSTSGYARARSIAPAAAVFHYADAVIRASVHATGANLASAIVRLPIPFRMRACQVIDGREIFAHKLGA